MTTLNTNEIKLIQDGFAHCVEPGYGKIGTTQDIIRILEVSLEQARRQQKIAKARREDNPNADTCVMLLEPLIKNITMRLGA